MRPRAESAPRAPRSSCVVVVESPEERSSRERRARFAMARQRLTYRKSGSAASLATIHDETGLSASASCAMNEAIARLHVDLRRHERDSVRMEDGFDVLLRAKDAEWEADGAEEDERSGLRRQQRRGSSKAACSIVSVCFGSFCRGVLSECVCDDLCHLLNTYRT